MNDISRFLSYLFVEFLNFFILLGLSLWAFRILTEIVTSAIKTSNDEESE